MASLHVPRRRSIPSSGLALLGAHLPGPEDRIPSTVETSEEKLELKCPKTWKGKLLKPFYSWAQELVGGTNTLYYGMWCRLVPGCFGGIGLSSYHPEGLTKCLLVCCHRCIAVAQLDRLEIVDPSLSHRM
jgi:hypothetical protein